MYLDFSQSFSVNENVVNKNICRCCLDISSDLKPIFNSAGSIPQAIFIFTSVQLEEHDVLPNTICPACIDHLNKCINFKQKVESSDLLFRQVRAYADSLQNESHSLKEAFSDHDYAKSSAGLPDDSSGTKNKSVTSPSKDKSPCKPTSSHQQLDRIESQFTCTNCQLNFMAKEDLFVHESLHDDTGNGFMCRSCPKKFTTFFKLKRHIPSHFKYKPLKCKSCDMRFVERASLTRHFRVHTGRKPISRHVCHICQKNFSCGYMLKLHNRRHTGECPWKCNACDKRFSDIRLLNSHKRIHIENKPFECLACLKSFRHRSTLVTHMKVHASNNNRPFRCDKCKKAFKKFYRLQIHKRQVHEKRSVSADNTNRFLCTQCSHVFASSAALDDHLRWHSKRVDHNERKEAPTTAAEEFFQCNECSLQFSSRLDLITHQKLKHTLRRHECFTCFGKWKTLEELIEHKCSEVLKDVDEPEADEMILLPNGQLQDCRTIVDALLTSVSTQRSQKATDPQESNKT